MEKCIIMSNVNNEEVNVILFKNKIAKAIIEDFSKAGTTARIISKGCKKLYIVASCLSAAECASMLKMKEGAYFLGTEKIIVVENMQNIDILFKQYEVIERQVKVDEEKQIIEEMKAIEEKPIKKVKRNTKRAYNEGNSLDEENEHVTETTGNESMDL